MITRGLEEAVEHFIIETMESGADANYPEKQVKRLLNEDIQVKKQEMLTLIRAEAINLADKIIGKDRTLHSSLGVDDQMVFDEVDKAVYDFQIKQRVILADYQKSQTLNATPTGPEMLVNSDLSENEA
jgi:hypothetical protein